MKPATFDYYRPETVRDAVHALAGSPGAKVLAGGQSLIPAMNFRLATPTSLIDIAGIEELQALEVTAQGVTIGASVTQSSVEQSESVAQVEPGLRAAIRWIGHLPIRNRGTVCGSLAHADPAAELPALALNNEAVLTLEGLQGTREVPAIDFIRGPFWTDLGSGELITQIRFPAPPPGSVTHVMEFARRAGDFATVGVVGRLTANTGIQARFTAFAVGGTPIRLRNVESMLADRTMLDRSALVALREASAADVPEPFDDIHASVEYRREALAALIVRAAQALIEEVR